MKWLDPPQRFRLPTPRLLRLEAITRKTLLRCSAAMASGLRVLVNVSQHFPLSFEDHVRYT
jgi:hypothetical protein